MLLIIPNPSLDGYSGIRHKEDNLHFYLESTNNTILSLYQIQKGNAAKLVLQHFHSYDIVKSKVGTICLASLIGFDALNQRSVHAWQHLEDER